MNKSYLAVSMALLVATGLAYGQKSPPYDPKTGVYYIDNSPPPQAKKSEKSTSSKETKSKPAQPEYRAVYPPGYWEKQKRLQDQEVAKYERRYREQKQAEEAAEKARIAAEEAAEKARIAAEEAEIKRKAEMKEFAREVARNMPRPDVHVSAPIVNSPPIIIKK